MERLQKVLAHAGVASRRRSEELITSGRVQVNGAVVTELGTQVDPERDEIRVDGRRLCSEPLRYLALHKPVGYVSTVKDPGGRPTVLDLVSDAHRLYPAGRLDADSEGLILLTNDGDVTLRLTHPRYGQRKVYLALVRGIPTPADLQSLRNGVQLEGGPARAVRASVVDKMPKGLAPADKGKAWVSVVVLEGRKRLVRVELGPLKLGELPAGQSRPLSATEITTLRRIREPGLPDQESRSETRRPIARRRSPGRTRDHGPERSGPRGERRRGPSALPVGKRRPGGPAGTRNKTR